MIDEVIREIQKNKGMVSKGELARRLDIDPEVLDRILEYLERKGKLSTGTYPAAGRSCSGRCGTCHLTECAERKRGEENG